MKRLFYSGFFIILFCLSSISMAQKSNSPQAQLPRKLPAKKAKSNELQKKTTTEELKDNIPSKDSPASTDDDDEVTDEGESPENSADNSPSTNPPPKKPRAHIDAQNRVQINYGYSKWNLNPTQIDSASIIIREGATGKIAVAVLHENAPDSSIFAGLYALNWRKANDLRIEFYMPDQGELKKRGGLGKIVAKINDKQMKKYPFILRRTRNGDQYVEIFDTKEQARTALKHYRAEQQLQLLQNKKVPSDEDVDTALLAEELKRKEAASQLLAERIRLGQMEARRLQELLEAFYKLTPAQRKEQKQKADQLAREGLAHFQAGQLPEAKDKFEQAVSLDPETRLYYFQFGVTLNRTNEYNRSIVYLELADGKDVNDDQRNYYLALDHYALKDFDSAFDHFQKVIAKKDPALAPSSQFYVGLIRFEQRKWPEAQAAFQVVLDTSSDPALDQQAENYIEQILRMKQFEAERAKKWTLSTTIGEMYDSNVLLTSTSSIDTGQATNSEGYRTLLTASTKYRPIYEATYEFATQLDFVGMYTVDNSFVPQQSLQNADPKMITLTFPWTRKGLLLGKGHKLDIVPGYEGINMSVENNESKFILHSAYVNFNNLLVMSNTWFANYNLEVRSDTSTLNSSTGDDNSSAIKVKLINTNLFMLTDDKSRILTADFSYTLNQAQGRNATFTRLDTAVGVIFPSYFQTTSNLKAAYFRLDYGQKTPSTRQDDSFTLSAAVSKKLTEIWSLGLLTSYNRNQSNNDSNNYKKGMAMITFSGSWNL